MPTHVGAFSAAVLALVDAVATDPGAHPDYDRELQDIVMSFHEAALPPLVGVLDAMGAWGALTGVDGATRATEEQDAALYAAAVLFIRQHDGIQRAWALARWVIYGTSRGDEVTDAAARLTTELDDLEVELASLHDAMRTQCNASPL